MTDHGMNDVYYDDPDDYEVCPNCMGDGEVPCHCGGDLCFCDNHGDAPCPTCHGEGEVTHERAERYFENLRRQQEMMREIMGVLER